MIPDKGIMRFKDFKFELEKSLVSRRDRRRAFALAFTDEATAEAQRGHNQDQSQRNFFYERIGHGALQEFQTHAA